MKKTLIIILLLSAALLVAGDTSREWQLTVLINDKYPKGDFRNLNLCTDVYLCDFQPFPTFT